MKIRQGEWVVASIGNGRYEVYVPGVIQSGAAKGKPVKKRRHEVNDIAHAIEFLLHDRIHTEEIETWDELRRVIDEFRAELTMLTRVRLKWVPDEEIEV